MKHEVFGLAQERRRYEASLKAVPACERQEQTAEIDGYVL